MIALVLDLQSKRGQNIHEWNNKRFKPWFRTLKQTISTHMTGNDTLSPETTSRLLRELNAEERAEPRFGFNSEILDFNRAQFNLV